MANLGSLLSSVLSYTALPLSVHRTSSATDTVQMLQSQVDFHTQGVTGVACRITRLNEELNQRGSIALQQTEVQYTHVLQEYVCTKVRCLWQAGQVNHCSA